MNVQAILDLARDQTHRNIEQVPDATAIIYLNAVYQQAASQLISSVEENYFMQTWVRDAELNQTNGEYSYPNASTTGGAMAKLLRLDVKTHKDNIYYTPADEVDIKNLPHSWDYYLANQPYDKPIFFIGDNSFFLAPLIPADRLGEAGNAQIKCTGIRKLVPLVDDAAESTILIPSEYHELLALGMEQFIYKGMGKIAEAQNARKEFNDRVFLMVTELTDRNESSFYAKTPDDVALQ